MKISSDITAQLSRVATALNDADRILLGCHRGPDGDSVGSMVALASLLREAGKHTVLHSQDPVPRQLKFLPHTRTWTRKLAQQSRYDVTVVVDCGDAKLLGKHFPPPQVTGTLIALDHHASVRPFGDMFVCDPTASSCGVMVARLAEIAGWPISLDAAIGLYVSLVSDTGSFRYSNTNREALELGARLVAVGVEPWTINRQLHEEVPLRRYKLLSAALSAIETYADGKVAVISVTAEMLKATGAKWEDAEPLSTYARGIAGVEVGVLLTPSKYGGIRVSMRSKARSVDAGEVCMALGGGGHRGAAGCNLDATLEDARAQVLAAVEGAIAGSAG